MSEVRPLIRLAIPVVLTQLGIMTMALVDLFMIGRLGSQHGLDRSTGRRAKASLCRPWRGHQPQHRCGQRLAALRDQPECDDCASQRERGPDDGQHRSDGGRRGF